MRQFITWQFWLSLAVLAALVGGLVLITGGGGADSAAGGPSAGAGSGETVATIVAAAGEGEAVHRVDLIALVFAAQADPGFQIVDGRTTASMQIRIDGTRAMKIVAGTAGENRCDALTEIGKCAVAAELLGESVQWFSILPIGARNTVALPAARSLQVGKRLLLANGWSVVHADSVKRDCATDSSSLTDFIRQFGDRAGATFSLDAQRVTAVTCEL
jgi:hypothetical protein